MYTYVCMYVCMHGTGRASSRRSRQISLEPKAAARRHSLDIEGWNSHVQKDFPGNYE